MQVREHDSMYNLDARSDAFVNIARPGMDGSVLGADVDHDLSYAPNPRARTLAMYSRNVSLWGAAVGGGLLALGVAYLSTRLWPRPARSRIGSLMRRRPRRWGFAR